MSSWQGAALAYLLTAGVVFVYAAIWKPKPWLSVGRVAFCLLWGVLLPLFVIGSLVFDEDSEDD